eukprot:scaffold2970_cov36-Cyclotella_meneghiniana.AAC.3
MHMLRFSAPRMCCRGGANADTVEPRAARTSCDFDRRWPWLKCQVDRPSEAGAITAAAQHPFF